MQIHQHAVRSSEQQGILETQNYHVDEKNIGHIMGILRNMYKDPVRAVVRETTCNALDAHVQAGIPARPIEVQAPSALEPIFRVRDFGPGLSKDETALLLGYGSSGDHKRGTNEQIGGFGIGAKAALSITSQFSYTIWNQGIKRVWSCYLDEHDAGRAALLSEEPSTEPSGVAVEVPIAAHQVDLVKKQLERAFYYWTIKPEVSGVALLPDEEPFVTMHYAARVDDRSFDLEIRITPSMQQENTSVVVMGGIAYPLEVNLLPNLSPAASHFFARSVYRREVMLPIGLVQVAPSRETLQYSSRTIKVLTGLLNTAVSDDKLARRCNELLAEPVGLVDKAMRVGCLFGCMLDAAIKTVVLPPWLVQPYSWDLSRLMFSFAPELSTDISFYEIDATSDHDGFFSTTRSAQVGIPAVEFSRNNIVVECSGGLCERGAMQGVERYLLTVQNNPTPKELCVLFVDPPAAAAMKASPLIERGVVKLIALSALPDLPVNHQGRLLSGRRRSRRSRKVYNVKSPATPRQDTDSKYVVLRDQPPGSSAFRGWWAPAKTPGGSVMRDHNVYVVIDGFRPVMSFSLPTPHSNYLSHFHELYGTLQAKVPGLRGTPLLGIRPTDSTTLKADRFTSLWALVARWFDVLAEKQVYSLAMHELACWRFHYQQDKSVPASLLSWMVRLALNEPSLRDSDAYRIVEPVVRARIPETPEGRRAVEVVHAILTCSSDASTSLLAAHWPLPQSYAPYTELFTQLEKQYPAVGPLARSHDAELRDLMKQPNRMIAYLKTK